MYLIPTDETFIEEIAKAIARGRMHNDTSRALQDMIGVPLEDSAPLERSFDSVFEILWAGNHPGDHEQRESYRSDALAAIRAINLKLMTTGE